MINKTSVKVAMIMVPVLVILAFFGYLEWRKSMGRSAVLNEDTERIDELMSNDMRLGRSMLVDAFTNEKKSVFTHLLEQGVDPNKIRANERNLIHAATFDSDLFWLKQLLNHGANPDEPFGYRNVRPLIYAIQENNLASVRLLVASGAGIDLSNKIGETNLVFAYVQMRGEIAYFLLEQGADFNPRGRISLSFINGYKAIEFSSNQVDPVKIRDYEFTLKIRQWFIDRNLDLNAAVWIEHSDGEGVWEIPPIK